jgi:hypothetical protein
MKKKGSKEMEKILMQCIKSLDTKKLRTFLSTCTAKINPDDAADKISAFILEKATAFNVDSVEQTPNTDDAPIELHWNDDIKEWRSTMGLTVDEDLYKIPVDETPGGEQRVDPPAG